MEIKTKEANGVITVSLAGELDHHGAASVRQEIDALFENARPKKAVLCLKDVYFCDSSGLGLIMGRYKKARTLGAEFAVADPSAATERIMKLAGLGTVIKTERSEG